MMTQTMMTQPFYRDRNDAGAMLAQHLERYHGADTVVLGIPRGGTIVAAEVARRLGAQLDVAVARKLPAPGQPEFAIGAVTAAGGLYLDSETIRWLDVPDGYVRHAVEMERAEAWRRERAFRGAAPPPTLAGRVVIVVDDGLATGATMRAALRALRRSGARRVIAAAPVGSPQACRELEQEADEVVCPVQPAAFGAVARFYEDFTQTTDREVQDALERSRETPVAGVGSVP